MYSSGFLNQFKIISEIKSREIDTIFLFHSNGPEDIFFSICSGAQNVLKMTDNRLHEYKKIFLNSPNIEIKHDIEKKLDLLRIFSPSVISKKMQIPSHFYQKKSIKKELDTKFIGIQLGAQDLYKIWPIDRFIALAERILKDFKKVKFILFGYTKYEKSLVEKFQADYSIPNDIENLYGRTSIDSLPSALNKLDLLITNDTGTFHLAVALKVKTVSLFGPTNSKVFGPYQDLKLHRVVQEDGYFVNKLPKKFRGQEGMELIDVDNVFDAVIKSLK